MNMKPLLVVLIFGALLVSCATPKTEQNQIDMSSAGMYRTIEKNGDQFTVTLHVVLPPGARFYFFEEKLPANAQLIKSDIPPSGTSIKEVFFSNVKNANYTYSIKADKGTFYFDGTYFIDGQTTDMKIKGAGSVTN